MFMNNGPGSPGVVTFGENSSLFSRLGDFAEIA
jgi:hypothetical protein